MKYGDIVVYNNKVGTVVKDKDNFKFLPCNYGRCYFSNLDTITDDDIQEATHDEKLELIEEEFSWGRVVKIHCIGEYQIVEYVDRRDHTTRYHGYINYTDASNSYSSLDAALVGCVGCKHEGRGGRAAMYFEKMIGLE